MRKYANDKDICGSKRQWCLTRDDWARARDVQRWGMELTEMELAAMEMSCSRRNRSRSGKDVEGQGTGGADRSGDLSGDRPQRQTFSLGGYTALGQCAQFQQTGLETWHVPRSLDTGTDGVYILNIASCLLRLEMLENTGP
jgi:hypothetical protein